MEEKTYEKKLALRKIKGHIMITTEHYRNIIFGELFVVVDKSCPALS